MRFLLLATVLFCVFSTPLQAASTEQQALDFGTLVSIRRARFMFLKMAALQNYYLLTFQLELS